MERALSGDSAHSRRPDFDAEAQHHDQGDGHDDALDQVGGGHGQEAAHDGIAE